MDGSSGMNGDVRANGYVDEIDPWSQQVEYHDIKVQQQLAKQHYGSPVGTPEHFTAEPNDEMRASLAGLDPQTQLLSDMEKLSNEYEPEVQGPLVGELKSSKALEEEYQNADPAFVRKTIALSPKYNWYRTIRGDGNCGWRAVAFRYFELLMKTHDPNRIGMEHARVQSLNSILDAAGFERYIYEDFANETFDLFRRMCASPYDESEILKSFNSQEISDAILTHFKFLTSAWMKTRPEVYESFLDRTVKEYCGNQIEPYGIEIDHVGLMALVDCLVVQAGFAVEVYYLDRSPGDEVNVHQFNKLDEETILPPDAPVLRLLYRPGHYDILYRKEDITSYLTAELPIVVPTQVQLMPQLPSRIFQETPAANFYNLPADPDFYPSDTGIGPSNFRQSMFSIPEFQPSPFQPLPFQTTTFRNSPFNPSHFQSENFQPEIYQPPSPANGSRRSDKHPTGPP